MKLPQNGDGIHQSSGVRVDRVAEKAEHIRFFNDPAIQHNRHIVAELGDDTSQVTGVGVAVVVTEPDHSIQDESHEPSRAHRRTHSMSR